MPETLAADTVFSIAGLKCIAAIITNTIKALTLRTVVIKLTLPAPFTPRIFTIVKNHNIPEVIKKANKGVAAPGTK
jgi:hypothetical protein